MSGWHGVEVYGTFIKVTGELEIVGVDRLSDSVGPDSSTVILDAESGERIAHFAELDLWPGNDPAKTSFYIRPAVRLRVRAAARIAVIGGDGIGPEVIDQAIRVAEAAARADRATLEWNRLPWGSAYYRQHGHILPPDGWDELQRHDGTFSAGEATQLLHLAALMHGVFMGPGGEIALSSATAGAALDEAHEGLLRALRDVARLTRIQTN